MTRYWLGVVQHEHVRRGVRLGIAQTDHGAKAGVFRMQPGDGLVYYSPKTALQEGRTLREFTAIGRIADAEPWQATDGDFHPWRRSVWYDLSATQAAIAPLLPVLELTRSTPNWGYHLRRGQLEISPHDFGVIARQMGSSTLEP